MKKSEAEKVIRPLALEWYRALPAANQEHPSYVEFKGWLRATGHDSFLQFRSLMGRACESKWRPCPALS